MEASIKEPNVLQTYEELKSDFEKYACRIDDVLLYPVLDTKNERTLYTLLQLKERFSHLKYLEGKTFLVYLGELGTVIEMLVKKLSHIVRG